MSRLLPFAYLIPSTFRALNLCIHPYVSLRLISIMMKCQLDYKLYFTLRVLIAANTFSKSVVPSEFLSVVICGGVEYDTLPLYSINT